MLGWMVVAAFALPAFVALGAALALEGDGLLGDIIGAACVFALPFIVLFFGAALP